MCAHRRGVTHIVGVLAVLTILALLRGPAAQPATVPAPASAAYGPDSSAGWLSTEGKNDKWIADTAECRRLLRALDLEAPRVKQHLPRVRAQAELVRRADAFNWKTITAVEFLRNTLEDLAAGKTPNVRYAGKQLGFAYWSETMRRIEAIWIHVPPGYDPQKDYQIFIYYKSGGGIHYKDGKAAGGYRPTAEMANNFDSAFQAWSSQNIQLKGRLGAHIELAEATAALTQEFSINPNRVFLTGYSDGGFTALWLASRYPHLVAGVVPSCANWQYTNVEQVGLYDVPLLVVDGWGDSGYVETNLKRFFSLANMGHDAAALIGQHGHTYAPFEDEETFGRMLAWAQGRERDLTPWRVRYATWNLAWNRAYWLTIERVIEPCLAAQIDARIKDANRIEVQASNVAAYRLALPEPMFSTARNVTVLTNGQASYTGPYKAQLPIELIPRPAGRFVKDALTPDEITARIEQSTYDANGYLAIPGRQWLHVRGTGGDDRTQQLLGRWCPKDAKPDTGITDDEIRDYNLFLYGGPRSNAVTARMAADLPVRFEEGRFRVGKATFDQPSHCVALLHPNPLDPSKYVIVYGFNDPAAIERNPRFAGQVASAWKFRTGDCVVAGIPAPPRKWGVALDGSAYVERHFVFDAAWQAESKGVGELAAPFDRLQLMRLRADAIREAAEADVGIIWDHTPEYLRWSDDLPAGPVTVADLATIDALPEYVTVGEMTGEQLARVRPVASTIVPDRRDPAHEPGIRPARDELDPAKTYRVAMGYWGIPAYRTNPGRMPKLFAFANEQEFLADENNGLTVRNMRQLPLEVTEAVARYIEKRGSVAPRPVCFDLAEYVMNPEDNEFGACDWLHVGFDGDWQDLQPGGSRPFRYTLNLGLRRTEDPQVAPPRKDSKRFLDLGPIGPTTRANVEFAQPDRTLPVTATMEARRFGIAAVAGDSPATSPSDPPGANYKIVEDRDGGDVIGRGLLLIVRLRNGGQRDVAGVGVLSPMAQMRVDPSTMRIPGRQAEPDYLALLPDFEQPTRSILLVNTPAVGKMAPMVVDGLGWNMGLIGLQENVTVPAGASAVLPVLLLAIDPDKIEVAPAAPATGTAPATQPTATRAAPRDAAKVREAQRAALAAVAEAIRPQIAEGR